ncbi:MAG TPA: hypothetical protein VKG43_11745 [Acidimicrobiales bacterium]|nr:hypothetical protein [Acidimicrobiales bacterium]
MPEGLSPTEVGKELADHKEHVATHHDEDGHSRTLTILEAILLAVVAVLAAWSGYASAKWGTDASLKLAKASATRTVANRVDLEGFETKNFDALTFNAWFDAYAARDPQAMVVAERRFRPQFDVAFKAWLATDPFTNPSAPKGPTYMPQYVQPEQKLSTALDTKADAYYLEGQQAGANSDNYVRTTVYLASVLFLVGISGHFAVRTARIGLVAIGGVILTFSIILLIVAPKPPV